MPVFLAQALPQGGPLSSAPPKPGSDGGAPARGFGVRRRQYQLLQSYPGATEPGTGHRHFPEVQQERSERAPSRERREKFEMRSSADLYDQFPGLVRASTPLYIKSAGPQEPLGQLEQRLEDAGPQTGARRPPGIVDAQGRQRPRLPSHPEDASELKRELETRYHLP